LDATAGGSPKSTYWVYLLNSCFDEFHSAHTVSDEGRLLKSQNELYKMEERLTRFSFLIVPLKARQVLSRSIKVWLDDIGLLTESSLCTFHGLDRSIENRTHLEIKSALSNGVSDASA
jgi:hypothetical protein